jgi:hypothetical protein
VRLCARRTTISDCAVAGRKQPLLLSQLHAVFCSKRFLSTVSTLSAPTIPQYVWSKRKADTSHQLQRAGESSLSPRTSTGCIPTAARTLRFQHDSFTPRLVRSVAFIGNSCNIFDLASGNMRNMMKYTQQSVGFAKPSLYCALWISLFYTASY